MKDGISGTTFCYIVLLWLYFFTTVARTTLVGASVRPTYSKCASSFVFTEPKSYKQPTSNQQPTNKHHQNHRAKIS